MEVKSLKLSEIKPYENNARFNDAAVEYVANSIREFGFQQPIVVDKDMVIIVGHTRYKAAQELGLKTVPVVVANELSDDKVKAYRLADNKTGEMAEWDFDKLVVELSDIDLNTDIDMSEFGFDVTFDANLEKEEIDELDDIEEDLPQEPISKMGQIYQLGRHRLMIGDSTDTKQVAALLDGEKADLLLTDPPYNIAYEGKTEEAMTIQNDNMSDENFRKFLVDVYTAANDNMKPGATFYIWYADTESYNFRGAARDIGWQVRENLIWAKNTFTFGRQDYQWRHEPCLYGWKEGAAHSWYADRKQTTVMEFDRPVRNDLHPTMKPVALFDYQMKNSSKPGDIVLDLFGGSGTTIVAAEQNGRAARLMEIDPRYADVIIKRYEDISGGKAVLVSE